MVSAVEDRHVLDRKFFGRMAIAIAVLVFIGFAPSFYLRGLIPFPRPNPTMTPLVWAHGLVFTGWVALFYAQARLVASSSDWGAERESVRADRSSVRNR